MINVSLVLRNGNRRGERAPVTGDRFLIGRHEDCTLRIHSERVSRRHCLLVCDEAGVTITDLGSRNGTIVGGAPLTPNKPFRLSHHDKIQIGHCKFRVSIRDSVTKQPIVVAGGADQEDSKALHDNEEPESHTSSAEDLVRELGTMADELIAEQQKRKQKSHHRDFRPMLEPERPLAVLDTPSSDASSGEKQSAEATKRDADDSRGDTVEISDDESKKLPEHLRPKHPADSQDAASEALKRHFSR